MKHIGEITAAHRHNPEALKRVNTLKSHLSLSRTWVDRVADALTRQFGTVWFLVFNVAFFLGWIEWNLGLLGLPPFDPFPFGLLTMIVSLEAIVLAIVVLISQNRQNRVADVRQQMDFEIDVRAEEEIKKVLVLLESLNARFGISQQEANPDWMDRMTDIRELQERVEDEINA